ncbi:hypothetical protein V9T40_000240 [Parthenolecanium corni]|uniref:Aquaporin n=1 Tax=Parthenolecanium corni TaxID=536013 RepID=A0AAN9Y056_9HEMI
MSRQNQGSTKRTNSKLVLSKSIMKSINERRKFDTLLEIFLAEIIGTGLLMYFGCMASFGSLTEVKPSPPMQNGLMFGFVVTALVSALGHISKAHLNISVTLCAYLLGTISTLTAIVYAVAQCIGATLGFYLLQVTTPGSLFMNYVENNSTCGFCTTTLAKDVSIPQGFLIELAATSFLILLVCSVWDPRNASTSDSVPIKFGLIISALSICAGPFTGASLNPARTLGPAIVNNIWDNHWLYWLAPLSGSAITTSFYKYVFMRNLDTVTSDETSSHSRLDSLKERTALNDNSSEEKSVDIA